ncbi:hypothetical protein AB0H76_26575 [Nocardia sp. NPDC050712]|uniref:hypothetical protein n=1 Tax=Nocardia sp. NPDC050712 TaxID=3155518 RepID=UPI0033E33E56
MFRETVVRAGRKVLVGVLPFAVVATFAGAGAASATDYAAQQARWAENLVASGNAEGIDYKTTVAPDLSTISTALTNGRFTLTADSSTVNVESATGAKVTELPLQVKTVAGNTIPLVPQVSTDGKSLVLTPQVSPAAATELQAIATNPQAQNPDPVLNGVAAGAFVGVAVAAILCLPALSAVIIGYLICVPLASISNVIFAAAIGAIVGAVAPQVVPQVLP